MSSEVHSKRNAWSTTLSLLPQNEDSSVKKILKVAFLIATLAIPLLIASIADSIQLFQSPDAPALPLAQITLEPNSDITTSRADFIVNAANSQMLGGGGVDGAISRAGGKPLLLARYLAPVNYLDGIAIRCPVGQAVRTDAGNLPASYCLHATGPNCQGGYVSKIHDAQLQMTYHSILETAHRTLQEIAQGNLLSHSTEQLNQALDHQPDVPKELRSEPGLVEKLAILEQNHYESVKRKIELGDSISISFPTLSTGIYAFPMKRAAQIAKDAFNNYLKLHENDPIRLKEIRVVFISGQPDLQFYSS